MSDFYPGHVPNNKVYVAAKARMLSSEFDWIHSAHKIALVDSTYTYSDKHDNVTDLSTSAGTSVVTYTEDIQGRALQVAGNDVIALGEWRVKVIDTTSPRTVASLVIVDDVGNLVSFMEDLPNLPIMPVQLKAGHLYITSDPEKGGWLRF